MWEVVEKKRKLLERKRKRKIKKRNRVDQRGYKENQLKLINPKLYSN